MAGAASKSGQQLSEVWNAAEPRGKVRPARAMTTMMAAPTLEEVSMFPGIVVGFLYFKKPVDVVQLRQVLKEKLLELPRFRSVVRLQGKKTVFIECDRDELPLDTMVQDLPIKSKQEVNEFLSKLQAERMGNQLPLWRAYTFNDMEDGRSCFVFVVDHCLGDGVSLVAVLMSMLDDKDDKGATSDQPAAKGTAAPRKRAIVAPSCSARVCAAVGGCCDAVFGDQLPGDPPSRLKVKDHRNPGTVKSVAQSEPIPVDKLKEVAALWGNGTVNDVLMALVTMTLQSYLEKCEPATLNQKLRAIFVLSLRPQGVDMLSEEWFGNIFSNGKIRFPMHLKSPKDIYTDVKRQIDYIKISPAPLITSKMTNAIANTTCISTQKKMDMVLDIYGKITACLSNIMGPSSEVDFLGQPLDDLQFYAFSPQGIYVGIISYNGKVSVGILIDATCEPDAQKVADEWKVSFDRLYAAAKA